MAGASEGTVKVFARKHFVFKLRRVIDGKSKVDDTAETRTNDFTTLPSWVRQDPLFEWARKDGDLEIIATREAEIKAELKAGREPKRGNRVRQDSVLSSPATGERIEAN